MSQAIGQEIGNKLSVKSFGWDKESILEAVMKDKENDVFLCRIGGIATGLRKYKVPEAQRKAGEENGFGLSGQFVGVNGATGEELKGSVLYLPRYVHDMVEAALSLGDDVAGVRIGFDIYARYDKSSATSYVFVARDLLNEGNSSVDQVRETMMALPMPTSAPALTDGRKGK